MMRILAAALGAAVATLLPVGAAQARAAGVEFAYDAPAISDEGDYVTWRWSMRNTEDVPAYKVVMTHKLAPALPVRFVSQGCEAQGALIRCRWDKLAAGQRVEGLIEADLPENLNGSVNVSGRLVWQ